MVPIRARAVLWTLLAVNAVFVIGFLTTKSVAIPSRAINRAFDLSAEASMAPWYSGSVLLIGGLVALTRGLHLRAGDRTTHWKAYLIVAAGLVFLSADEVAQIHETVSGTMHRRAAVREGAMADVQSWDVVTFLLYAAAGLAAFALLRRDVLALLRESRGRTALLAGGTLFVVGAVFIDQLHLGRPMLRVAVEDGMEMTGEALMLYALLLKLGTVTLSMKAAEPIVAAPAAAAARADTAPAPPSIYDDEEFAGIPQR